MKTRSLHLGLLLTVLALLLLACEQAKAEEPTAPEYLEGAIQPCTPVDGVDVDPCKPRAFYGVQPPGAASGRSPDIDTTVPYTIRRFLHESIAAAHLVVRGTYLPRTSRCATNQGVLGAEWAFGEGGLILDWPSTKCYLDMRVSEYYLGSGPPMLTVMLQSFNQGADHQVVEARYNRLVGLEEILFVGPALDYNVEALQVYERWDVQRVGDSVIAVHPDRNYWLRVEGETHRGVLEMSLDDFAAAVTAAQAVRMADFGGKVGPESDSPSVQTDANKLHDFYVDAGAIENADDTLILPPPVR